MLTTDSENIEQIPLGTQNVGETGDPELRTQETDFGGGDKKGKDPILVVNGRNTKPAAASRFSCCTPSCDSSKVCH